MNLTERKVVYEAAELLIEDITVNRSTAEIELDASAVDNEGFDPVEDGVWVQAWIKVPAHRLINYTMPLASSPMEVKTILAPVNWPFQPKP